ncbi:MAG TPA: ATP-binding protein [Methylococcaceae bacterium]|nr:ATP-binding protein [Methylococcaceae bacterium]
MKRFFDTLLARVLGLVALLLVIGQFSAFQLAEFLQREPRAAAIALQAISTVNLTRAALLAAHEKRRSALLDELAQREGVRVYPLDPLDEVDPLPREAVLQLAAEKIRAELGADTLVAADHLGLPGLWVSFNIDEDDYWAVIPRARMERTLPWHWLSWGTGILLLSLGGAWAVAARVNRPLHRLAEEADRIGRGEPGGPLPEKGTRELRHVTRAFNAMRSALEQLDAERALLLAGVSHDLRTPLARLRLAVEMLDEADGLKSGMVQDIEDMNGVLGQFLDFVRGVAGETPESGDLDFLVRGVIERYDRAGKPIAFSLPALPPVMLYPLAMRRLLTNLVDNAIAHGGGTVEVVARPEAEGVGLRVLDRGPGIPEMEKARLLKPFERLDAARSDGGSGLGLAIAARIARLHGGRLELNNRPGGGLEVHVWLPRTS